MKLSYPPKFFAGCPSADVSAGIVITNSMINAIGIAYALRCAANIIYEHGDPKTADKLIKQARQYILDTQQAALHEYGMDKYVVITIKEDIDELQTCMQEILTEWVPF